MTGKIVQIEPARIDCLWWQEIRPKYTEGLMIWHVTVVMHENYTVIWLISVKYHKFLGVQQDVLPEAVENKILHSFLDEGGFITRGMLLFFSPECFSFYCWTLLLFSSFRISTFQCLLSLQDFGEHVPPDGRSWCCHWPAATFIGKSTSMLLLLNYFCS